MITVSPDRIRVTPVSYTHLLTQNEFAKQIGVEQVTISRNELGKTDPSAKLLERVYILSLIHIYRKHG